MSGEATGFVWRSSPYRGATFAVHLAIADVVNDAHDNEFWMALKPLAAKARVSRPSAARALDELIADGYLERLTGLAEDGSKLSAGAANRYRFEVTADRAVWQGEVSPRDLQRSHHETREVSPRDLPSYIANEKERKKRDVSVAEAECPTEGRELIGHFCSLLDGNEVRYSVGSTWFDAMRLMLVKDNRKAAEVAAVMDWAAGDEFWRANVLSIPALREKFDKLRLSMKRTRKYAVGPTMPSEEEIVAGMRRDRGDDR